MTLNCVCHHMSHWVRQLVPPYLLCHTSMFFCTFKVSKWPRYSSWQSHKGKGSTKWEMTSQSNNFMLFLFENYLKNSSDSTIQFTVFHFTLLGENFETWSADCCKWDRWGEVGRPGALHLSDLSKARICGYALTAFVCMTDRKFSISTHVKYHFLQLF